jgi:serine phosphatase RsbU (regulator of sigma subunit)
MSEGTAMALQTPGGTRLPRVKTPSGKWVLPRLLGGPSGALPSLDAYFQAVIHEWARTLAALGFTLIPLSFVVDWVMVPPQLLARFTAYRAATTAILVGQALVLRATAPAKASYLHGYFFSLVVASMISLMTTQLGGFNSTYYAGLTLVMVAVNLTLPWRAVHSLFNSAVIIGIYVAMNLTFPSPQPVERVAVINNLYFLGATGMVTVAINWVKEKLIRQEFLGRRDLQKARDALWSEMAVAKRIQTSLLPRVKELDGWKVAATMVPAEEIGGDYYDVIQNPNGELWAAIGDVSGHGVESGLIMMMTQTSIATAAEQGGRAPSEVLGQVNRVVNENIVRLGVDRYVTVTAMVVRGDTLTFAGKHQDMLIWRADEKRVEIVPTQGTWLGMVVDLQHELVDQQVRLGPGDTLLLCTDGVTEATDSFGHMYGQERLAQALAQYSHLEVEEIVSRIVGDVKARMATQTDDLTLVAIRRSTRRGQTKG